MTNIFTSLANFSTLCQPACKEVFSDQQQVARKGRTANEIFRWTKDQLDKSLSDILKVGDEEHA
ncbi:MAG: hypothetical protein K2Z81_17655 [Cyanobacteria bacterium]|nr:hypothetical protein [Cyanobacteriota bacterium]